MRIALQISGELRTLKYCYPNLKKYIFDVVGHENIDIFLHTWFKESDEQSSGHGDGIALLNPRCFKVENYEELTFLHSMPRSMTMFYSIWKANECRKEYEKMLEMNYNIIIRYRTDCLFGESPLTDCKLFYKEQKPFLAIPKAKRITNADGPVDMEEKSMICDWFAYGTGDLMNIYCDTYNTWLKMGIYPVPESMLFLQCKMYGITEQTFLKRPSLDFFLIESNGKIRGLDECVKEESKNS